jgi:Flp pilus assembly protein CpaB
MVGSFAAVVLLGQRLSPQPTRVVVAGRDLAPGDVLRPEDLAVASVGLVDADPGVLATLITEEDIGRFLGATVILPVYTNQPLLRSMLGESDAAVSLAARLEADMVAAVVPVGPDLAPEGIRVGDYVDLTIHIGALAAQPLTADPVGAESPIPALSLPVTPSAPAAAPAVAAYLPLAKTLMTNAEVLDVVRRAESRVDANGAAVTVLGPVTGLVLAIPRDAQEVLQFGLQTGLLRVALVSSVVAAEGTESGARRPTLGMTWDDLVALIELERQQRLEAGTLPDPVSGPGAALSAVATVGP